MFKKKTYITCFFILATILVSISPAAAIEKSTQKDITPNIVVPASKDTVVYGFIGEAKHIAKVKPGQIVQMDTITHAGLDINKPEEFFKTYNIPLNDPTARDTIEIFKNLKSIPTFGPTPIHILTGPVYIEGAEPGDILEVRMIDIKPRIPYGASSLLGLGSLGEKDGYSPDKPYDKIIPLDLERNVALFNEDIEIPIKPFMGVMGVAPAEGWVDSVPPGSFGGNLDIKELTKGSTLYLPVYKEGALFFTGDGHIAQGDGEVSIQAIEGSLSATFQFFVHKKNPITEEPAKEFKNPFIQTPSHYISVGLDEELDQAMLNAILETIDFLQVGKGLNFEDAYQLASFAVDFRVSQIVDGVKGIHGMIPKNIFIKDYYWFQE